MYLNTQFLEEIGTMFWSEFQAMPSFRISYWELRCYWAAQNGYAVVVRILETCVRNNVLWFPISHEVLSKGRSNFLNGKSPHNSGLHYNYIIFFKKQFLLSYFCHFSCLFHFHSYRFILQSAGSPVSCWLQLWDLSSTYGHVPCQSVARKIEPPRMWPSC